MSTSVFQRKLDLAPTATIDKVALNNTVVGMRAIVKRARLFVINDLVKKIHKLRDRKGTEDVQTKNKNKADRLLEEVQILKNLKPDYVSKYALGSTEKFEDIMMKFSTNTDMRALARLAHQKFIQERVKVFRSVHPDWKELAAYLMTKQTSREFKKKKIKEKMKKIETNVKVSETLVQKYLTEKLDGKETGDSVDDEQYASDAEVEETEVVNSKINRHEETYSSCVAGDEIGDAEKYNSGGKKGPPAANDGEVSCTDNSDEKYISDESGDSLDKEAVTNFDRNKVCKDTQSSFVKLKHTEHGKLKQDNKLAYKITSEHLMKDLENSQENIGNDNHTRKSSELGYQMLGKRVRNDENRSMQEKNQKKEVVKDNSDDNSDTSNDDFDDESIGDVDSDNENVSDGGDDSDDDDDDINEEDDDISNLSKEQISVKGRDNEGEHLMPKGSVINSGKHAKLLSLGFFTTGSEGDSTKEDTKHVLQKSAFTEKVDGEMIVRKLDLRKDFDTDEVPTILLDQASEKTIKQKKKKKDLFFADEEDDSNNNENNIENENDDSEKNASGNFERSIEPTMSSFTTTFLGSLNSNEMMTCEDSQYRSNAEWKRIRHEMKEQQTFARGRGRGRPFRQAIGMPSLARGRGRGDAGSRGGHRGRQSEGGRSTGRFSRGSHGRGFQQNSFGSMTDTPSKSDGSRGGSSDQQKEGDKKAVGLHPSWEASKKRKQEQKNVLQVFTGKKIKFDE